MPKTDESDSKCLKLEEMALNACIEDMAWNAKLKTWL